MIMCCWHLELRNRLVFTDCRVSFFHRYEGRPGVAAAFLQSPTTANAAVTPSAVFVSRRFMLRSTSKYVDSFCSISRISDCIRASLTATQYEFEAANMFEKIVVGVDGSPESEHAFSLACDLAQKYNSELHLVHTPQPQTVAFAMGAVAGYHAATTMPSSEEIKMACDKIVSSAEAIAEKNNQKITQTHLERGDPADQIIACAKGCGADLIITGRRGLGSVGSLLQGSTSQRVNHLAKCACMSVV